MQRGPAARPAQEAPAPFRCRRGSSAITVGRHRGLHLHSAARAWPKSACCARESPLPADFSRGSAPHPQTTLQLNKIQHDDKESPANRSSPSDERSARNQPRRKQNRCETGDNIQWGRVEGRQTRPNPCTSETRPVHRTIAFPMRKESRFGQGERRESETSKERACGLDLPLREAPGLKL